MALFHRNFLSSEEVVSWADDQLLRELEPFDYISELSVKGPKKCAALAEHEFPAAREFTYIEEFSLRTKELDVESKEQVKDFVNWITSASMGLDIEIREVHLGYLLDHYFLECDDLEFANNFLKEELDVLIPKNKNLAQKIWQEIA